MRTLFSEGSFNAGWNEKTSLDGYALNTASAALTRYNNTMSELNNEEKILRQEFRKTTEEALKNKAELDKTIDSQKKKHKYIQIIYK